MLKAYKYRIYPTTEQKSQIDKTIGVCRLVYNLALEVKIRAWQEFGIRVSATELEREIKELRKNYAWIAEIDCSAIHTALRNLDTSFKNFFKGSGFPKFKSKRSNGSFRLSCGGTTRKINWDEATLSITKISNIPIRISREFEGEIKTITISKTSSNKYFASILVKTEQKEIIKPKYQNAIGIDLGVKDFAVLSTGEKISNPRHLQTELRRLKVLQRRVSRKKKGSKNRRKAILKIALLHERIANQRNDFLHKLSTKLISDNQTDTICVESLAVSNMVRNHNLAQAISDVSWSEFVRQLEYKGKWYGKNIIKIDRFFASSKTCSDCGHVLDNLDLSIREWVCPICGTIHDRDINAAINIKYSGMRYAEELAELSPIGGAVKQETSEASGK